MEIQHPLYHRIFFVASETHPAVRPQAEQRRPAYDALRRELRQHGFHGTAYEAKGDFWIDELGESITFYETRRLTEARV